MFIYISPILGEHSEDFYYKFQELKINTFTAFVDGMRSGLGYRELRSAILVVEDYFKGSKVSGTDIYNYLTKFGFSESNSINVTRLFSTNNRLVERLVDQGFSVNDVVYGMVLKSKLESLGLKSATTNTSYALGDNFVVYPILKIELEEEVPPPPEYELWRPFQISVLIDCTTSDPKGRAVRRSIEFRGVFTAERNSIIDWNSYNKKLPLASVYKLLGDVGTVAESVMKEYAAHKGYQDLFECAVPVFDGINLLEDLPDILVEEPDDYETENSFEVIDHNRSETTGKQWGNFSDTVKYTGKWWLDESKAIVEMRRQVQSESRW